MTGTTLIASLNSPLQRPIPPCVTRRICFLGRRYHYRCTRLPRERIHSRLEFFTQRYATHVPAWQFAIWLRQFALFCVAIAADVTELLGGDAQQVEDVVKVQAAAATVILLIAWGAHSKVRI